MPKKSEDFEIEIERSDRLIKPSDKLSDFAKIKVSAIDPFLAREIRGHINNIRRNIDKIKEQENL